MIASVRLRWASVSVRRSALLPRISEVLILRVDIFDALGKWDLMEAVARQFCRRQPDEPDWYLKLATATRRASGLQEALAVLATVANRFPTCAVILYNLACYAAQLGHLNSPGAAGRGNQTGFGVP